MYSSTEQNDVRWMNLALAEAEEARGKDEVPVGAVIVLDGRVIGRGHNQVETLNDPTAHAEIIAIGAAGSFLGSWRLEDATMYVTLEPCAMCAGAIVLARLKRLVFGARDPKAGACGSVMEVIGNASLNHKVGVESGVLQDEAALLLKEFFGRKRRDARAVESGGLENR
ncbi:MAG: tRNA adenosine(34) deaminase TadA [Candidatus Eisenbacteria bacterium]|nr:tRNA adenosine(34) deaminase TadA [Candidatus Eisenbacteria bacterium]